MPDTATTPTASNAQTRAAGTRMLGFYEGVGGVKVDALIDPANFVFKDSIGNVGIGAAAVTPVYGRTLQVSGDGDNATVSIVGAGGAGFMATSGANLYLLGRVGTSLHLGANDDIRMTITTAGRVGVGTISPGAPFHVARSGAGEAIRFGSTAYQMGYLGEDEATNTVIIGNRYADATNCNISFRVNGATTEKLRIRVGSVTPGADNAQSLGHPSFRWDVVYAVTNAISTCDIRFKTFRAEPAPTAAELRAGLRCILEIGFHQFNDAIALKGPDGARWHIGPGAQPAWQIFADEGLCDALIEDAETGELVPPEGSIPPACLCFDKIEEECEKVMEGWRPSLMLGPDGEPIMVRCADGEEATEQRPTGETVVTREAGNIFGVRVDQLQLLMLAALNAERLQQEARLAALEAA